MAGETSKDVALKIYARDYSQKTLSDVVKALDKLTDSQSAQIEGAKKGEVTASALAAAYSKIEDAQKALAKQNAAIETFKNQNLVLEQLTAKLAAAREAQATYLKTVDDAEKPTAKQRAELNRLSRAVTQAEAGIRSMGDNIAKTTEKLDGYGIQTSQLAQAQSQISAAFAKGNAALETQHAALDTYDATLREHIRTVKAAADAQAQADKAAADAANAKATRDRQLRETRTSLVDQRLREIGEREQAAEAERLAQKKRVYAFNEAMAEQRMREIGEAESLAAAKKRESESLRVLAQQLEASSKGYTTLARTSANLKPANFRLNISDIADPSAAVMRSVDGIEASIKRLQAAATNITGPVKNAASSLRELAEVQKSIGNIAGQIDAYRNQMQVLRQARAEYVTTRAAAAALVQQMNAGVGGDNITNKVRQTEAALKSASTEMQKQIRTTRELRDALTAAGVDTSRLSREEIELAQQAVRAAGAVKSLTDAVKQNGVEKEKNAGIGARFNKGERESLSLYQRIRGEVISLATAYVGLQAVLGTAKGAIDAINTTGKIESRLGVMFAGDTVKIRSEWDYIRVTAERLRIPFEEAAQSYTKIGIAAVQSGMSVEQGRFIFENFALAARKAGLSGDEFNGVMLAVQQMISKGKITSEELVQQLAERLPGAVSVAAQSLGKSVPDMLKQMQTVGISSNALINIAEGVGKAAAASGESAASKTQQAANDLKTQVFFFQKALAESGFIDAYTEFLGKLTGLLNSEGGRDAAKAIGVIFETIVTVASIATENIGLLTAVLGSIAGLKVWGFIAATVIPAITGLTGAFIATRTAATAAFATMGAAAATGGVMATAATGITAIGMALKFVGRAIPIIGTLILALDLGYEAYQRFITKKNEAEGAASAKPGAGTAGNPRKASGVVGATPNPGGGYNESDETSARLAKEAEERQKGLDGQSRTARIKGVKGELEERKRIATETVRTAIDEANKTVAAGAKKNELLGKLNAQLRQIEATEEQKFNNEQATRGAGAGNRRVTLAQDIANQLKKIRDDVEKEKTDPKIDPNVSYADREKARVDAIGNSYLELRKKIQAYSKFDPKGSVAATKELDGYVAQVQALERKKAKIEELNRLEKTLSNEQDKQTRRLEENKALYDAGLISLPAFQSQNEKIVSESAAAIGKAAADVGVFAESMGKLLDDVSRDTLNAKLSIIKAQNNPEKTNAQAAVAVAEETVNRTLEERQRLLDEIESLRAAELITADEAVNRSNKVNGQFKQTIIDQTSVLLSYIDAVRDLKNADGTSVLNEEARAKIEAMRQKFVALRQATAAQRAEFSTLDAQIISSAQSGIGSALDGFVTSLGKMVTGQEKFKTSMLGMVQAVGTGFASILGDLGQYILKMEIANALAGSQSKILSQVGRNMGGTALGGIDAVAGVKAAASDITGTGAKAATAAATDAAAQTTVDAAAQAAQQLTQGATIAGQTAQLTSTLVQGVEQTAAIAQAGTDQAAAVTFASTVVGAGVQFAATVAAASASGSGGSALSAIATVAAAHSGGIAGAPKGITRSVNPSWFSTAQRLHSGGMPGLSNNEVPTVLLKNEEVLTRDDPRHMLNGGKSSSSKGQRIVLVDDRARVPEAMASAEGEQVTLMHLKRNLSTVKRMLKG